MIPLIVSLTVKNPSDVARVQALLEQQKTHSLKEPGCLRFEVYHSTADATRFFLCEHWESEAALATHRTAHAYTTIYQPQVLPLVNREGHPSQLV